MRTEQTTNLANLPLATHALHRQLDQSDLVRMLLTDDMSIANYRQLLIGFYQAYLCVEPAIQTFEAGQKASTAYRLDPTFQPRLPELCAELKRLLVNTDELLIPSLPVTLRCAAASLGTRYVLDGSCHGAKWLLPRLQQHIQLSKFSHFEYWTLLANINADWLEVCQAIDAQPKHVDAQQLLIDTAQSTFQLFIQQINDSGATQ